MQTELPYAPGTTAGVFACRPEYRPNPIAMTVCKVLAVDEGQGMVTLAKIDAFDGSPVLDLKGYIPVCDRVQKVCVPHWYDGWPEWMPNEGLGLD
jgi:tRNA (Thr-GGU) A37 N-methylase